MSHQVRCKCGWSSQVSEFYLGDRITCPECSAKIEVRENAGVPYAYAPYPTWQKEVPSIRTARAPRRRKIQWHPQSDPHASPAFWLGVFAFSLVLMGCGFFPGILLSLFAIRSASSSRRFCEKHGLERPVRASLGGILGVGTLALGLTYGAVLLIATTDSGSNARTCESRVCDPREVQPDYTEYNQRRETERLKHEQARAEEWRAYQRQMAETYEYKYPVDPKPQPVAPRNDFERDMSEYSQRVYEHRQNGAPKPQAPDPNKYRD